MSAIPIRQQIGAVNRAIEAYAVRTGWAVKRGSMSQAEVIAESARLEAAAATLRFVEKQAEAISKATRGAA